ncbi:SDR family NAD(P)-dependent oxidoreductase [Hymenobacter sp. YC55]|uniref:SDR family oxidoreductase n=1 Tax=Hymenobacter sp. YC55 TaxID=3034019 RepID=UPI0023F8E979|nr:SDR family NAD(P)-dependent oxidoreductase [Hymenobacter sp. YC55]MDF7813770.1 SDR family NAD(P)-dependent oxidoreductase [Hymenobacter sp. YC55]
MDVRQNTILITGGTSGFGYAFAARLLELGNTVLITGRNQAKLDETKRRLPGVHTFRSDVSDPEAIARLYQQVVSEFPALNVLINNAGEMRKLNLQDPTLDLRDLTREVDINLVGPIRMVQQFLPHLKTKKTAALLNVTSGLAMTPFPLAPIYSGTKAGLRAYTKALRVQLQHTPVKVFELVAPAAKTPLADPFAGVMAESMLMAPDKVVAQAIEGLQHDRLEIYPGLSRILRYMSRLAPGVLLKQMSKGVTEAFAQPRVKA